MSPPRATRRAASNYATRIELTESRVRLRTGRGVLSVLGEGLRLRELSVDAALIEGHVLTATYAGGGRTP